MDGLTADEVRGIRRVHAPVQACSACSRWDCQADSQVWPCDTERRLRGVGWQAHSIYDYANPTADLA